MKTLKILIPVVLFALVIIPSINAQPVVLLSETFETSVPPPGWTVSTSIGQNQWLRNDVWGRPNYTPGSDGYCADNDDAAAGPGAARVGDNTLSSGTFDALYYDIVWLAYDVDWYPVGTYLVGKVDVYNGSSWSTVMSHPLSHKTTRDSINISALVAGKNTGRVRFYYHETSGGVKSNWYEVDDVKVWGSSFNPPDTLDLAIVEILRPLSFEKAGVAFIPACRISNNLDTTAHATVSCRIVDIRVQEQVYEDSYTNYPLPGGTSVVNFDPFIPEGNAFYNATFTVEHPNDANPTNNTKSKAFSTAEYDVTPYLMEDPETPTQLGPFRPAAYYAERKGKPTVDVKMLCWIQDMYSEEWVYRDSLDLWDFDAFDTFLAVFDTAELVPSTYIIRFWANGEYNVNISNPPLVDTFDYTGIAEAPIEAVYDLEVPFNGNRISFSLPKNTGVDLEIYGAAGTKVADLFSGTLQAGSHTFTWNGNNAATGIYFVKLTTPEFTAVRKLVLLK